ncbi:hypothetical protein B0H13DRAFT_2342962 [Mycena leptocephala]|nr:hypothetical protein B0H13DRAFT_2342962 [Mycena leptocephala]
MTRQTVEQYLGDAWVVWVAAQRTSFKLKIDTCVEKGMNWMPYQCQPLARHSAITEWHLDSSHQFGDWSVQPGCPLDLTGLRDVYIHQPTNTNFLDNFANIAVNALHALTSLRYADQNDLQTIARETEMFRSTGEGDEAFHSLDTVLAARPMSSLRKVEAWFCASDEDRHSGEATVLRSSRVFWLLK